MDDLISSVSSAVIFLNSASITVNLFGKLSNLFKSEQELRELWSNPMTRGTFLKKLNDVGFGKEELTTLKQLIDAEKSDLFDVLEYVFNSDINPMTGEELIAEAQGTVFASFCA